MKLFHCESRRIWSGHRSLQIILRLKWKSFLHSGMQGETLALLLPHLSRDSGGLCTAKQESKATTPLVPPLRANTPLTCKPYQTSENPPTCRPCLIFSKDTFPWGTTSLLFQNLLPVGLVVLQMGWCRSHSKPVPVTVTLCYCSHSQSVKEGDPSEMPAENYQQPDV